MTYVPPGHPFAQLLQQRFNPNHDPDTGQFTSGDGGGSGGSVAPTESIPVSAPNASKPKPAEAHSATSYEFVSPSVASHLDFNQAVDAISSDQHRELREASLYINGALHLDAREYDIVGAWADGAENSVMDVVEGSDWDRLKLGASMKGWLADQKQVLIFQEMPHGTAAMAHFEATGSLADIHAGLLQDGVAFHTLVPHEGGATVYVADLDGSAADAIEKAAARYDAEVGIKWGRAEFLGTTKQDGTDREQRDDARNIYEENIRQSKVAGHDQIWSGVRDRWGSEGIHRSRVAASASALFDKHNDPTASADAILSSVPGAAKAAEAAERNLEGKPHTDAPTSQGGFKQADGAYTSERSALHDQILRELFNPAAVQAAKPAPGERPTMTLLGGRGGSGKSWFTKTGVADGAHAIYINADDIQAKLPGYQGWNAALYHEEASDITKQADTVARTLGVSVIHDATMRTPGGSAKRVADYKASGYAVHGHYMFLPPQLSTKRAMERFVRGGSEGRYVPASYLLNSTTNERTFDTLKGSFDKWSIYDNSGASPQLVAEGGASEQEKRNGRYSERDVRERSQSAGRRQGSRELSQGVLGSAGRMGRGAEKAPAEGVSRRAFSPITAYTEALFARYNENHDPDNGQFTSGSGGGSGGSVAPTGTVEPAKAEPVLHPDTINVSGDEWNTSTARRLETEYQAAKPELEQIVQGGIGSSVEGAPGDEDDDTEDQPFVPEDWDSLSGDQQDQAKEAYMKQNLDSWIESENNNYFENGDALDDAKRQLAEGFNDLDGTEDWARDALQEYLDDRAENDKPVPYTADQLLHAIHVEYQDGYSGDGKFTVDFDNEQLTKPSTLIEGQELLPGIEPIHPSAALSIQMRDEIEALLTKEFDKAADKKSGDMEPPDYLNDSAQEGLEEDWDHGLDDDAKFNWIKNNTDILDEAQQYADQYAEEHAGSNGAVADPNSFSVDPLNADSGADYRKTQALAGYLSLQRQAQIIEQRGIKDTSKYLEDGEWKTREKPVNTDALAKFDKQLWSDWKGSSTSFGGQILQLATADELGGRYRDLPTHKNDLVKQANEKFRNIGGYAGVKALVRAKWETTQYLLDKADLQTVEVYRGMKVNLPEDEKLEPVTVNGRTYQRISDAKLMRNGAWSTTIDRSIANNWNLGSGTKIVMRIDAPRTAVLSVPAYGINVHKEQELVLAGTAYKHWDTWKGNAPGFTEVPIGAAPQAQKAAA